MIKGDYTLYIPCLLFGLVAVFVLLDCVLIGIAFHTFTGTYTDNYYQKGVDFDKINRQSVYQGKVSWKSEIIYDRKSERLIFKLTGSFGEPLSGAKVLARIMHPITNKFDSMVVLVEGRPGEYCSGMTFPGNGQWDIRVKATIGDKEYVASRRFLADNE